MIFIAFVLFVLSLFSFFGGALGPGIGFLVLAVVVAGLSD